jgi:hypothetical protein
MICINYGDIFQLVRIKRKLREGDTMYKEPFQPTYECQLTLYMNFFYNTVTFSDISV